MSCRREGERWEPGLTWISVRRKVRSQRGVVNKTGRMFFTHTEVRKAPHLCLEEAWGIVHGCAKPPFVLPTN